MSDTLSSYFTEDHRACDIWLTRVEDRAAERDWEGARAAVADLTKVTLNHLRLEEEVLFPDLKQAHPGALGPTSVMRGEHAQARRLLEDLSAAVAIGSRSETLGLVETLLMLLQQHNAKEEGILYPMADAVLRSSGAELAARLRDAPGPA
jgi:iron-sulfur cluster repair protein YtfE (RIC family)